MLSMNKFAISTQRVLGNGIYFTQNAKQLAPALNVCIIGQRCFSDNSKQNSFFDTDSGVTCVEGFQGELRDWSLTDARSVISRAKEYNREGPTLQGVQGHVTIQTGPTRPRSTQEPLVSKYSNGNMSLQQNFSQFPQSSRQVHTSSSVLASQQWAEDHQLNEESILKDPTLQGIQGDNCVAFKLWMENCQRYHLPNCDEQLEALKNGRKTLAEVFKEQQDIIRLVAESYRHKPEPAPVSSAQAVDADCNSDHGQQDYFHYSFDSVDSVPCPQGLQGEDCANFQVWNHNCQAYGLGDCDQQLKDVQTGRKTLQDIFDDQDGMIRKIVTDYQQKRAYSTSPSTKVDTSNSDINDSSDSKSNSSASESPASTPHSIPPDNSESSTPNSESNNLTAREKLQRAVKEYGSTVIVFHVAISLASLGGFYLLVSSGFEGPAIQFLYSIGFSESVLQSKLATGTTTFAVAYIIHKCFAPARIFCTLSCTPFIVRHLRKIGFLKPPKHKSN